MMFLQCLLLILLYDDLAELDVKLSFAWLMAEQQIMGKLSMLGILQRKFCALIIITENIEQTVQALHILMQYSCLRYFVYKYFVVSHMAQEFLLQYKEILSC